MVFQTLLNFTQHMIRNWKESPGKLALFLGMVASLVIARWIYHTFFPGSDRRLAIVLMATVAMATAYAHILVYRRESLRSLRDELLSWGIAAAGLGAGIWISFAYMDGDSFLGDLPIIAGLFVAWGVDSIVRKRFREARKSPHASGLSPFWDRLRPRGREPIFIRHHFLSIAHNNLTNGRLIRKWTESLPDGEKYLTCTQASSGPSQSFSWVTGLAALISSQTSACVTPSCASPSPPSTSSMF